MLEWLNENPIVVFVVLAIAILIFMFVFVKVKKKKPAKVEEKSQSDKTTATSKETEEGATEAVAEEINEPPVKIRAKHAKTRPQIEQIYKRVIEKSKKTDEKQAEENIDGKEAQFVKTSNKVSKFVGFEEIAQKEEAILEEMQHQAVVDSDCEICEPKFKHFDRTRRLSKMIKNDTFDDMLDAHISEHYLNIDEKRHLRICEDFSEKLFERAMKTLSNSDVKVLVDKEDSEEKHFEKMRGDKEYMKQWLADRKRENMAMFISSHESVQDNEISEELAEKLQNEIDLSPKNIIVTDTVLKRKGKRKN